MLIIIVLLPLIIVKGCNYAPEEVPSKDSASVNIKVYIKSENVTREMPLEEYLKGVVAAEMPADFHLEALKAQAIAARTYAFSRMEKLTGNDSVHPDADICTDSTHCQAWTTKDAMMKKWGFFAGLQNWNKIQRAVDDTAGVIITYNGSLANPVFHASSGGRTENAENVWAGGPVAYLKSVSSEGEEASPNYIFTQDFKNTDFVNKLKAAYPDIKLSGKDPFQEIKVLSYTPGGRVENIKIGNITLKGTDVRKVFGLRSANFKIEKGTGEALKITTQGYGHGVGMSQWGANALAKKGAMYEEIIKYYYQGVNLDTISNWRFTKGTAGKS